MLCQVIQGYEPILGCLLYNLVVMGKTETDRQPGGSGGRQRTTPLFLIEPQVGM